MKRLGIILLVVLVLLATFWVGLMLNFPGESVSRYVERQVNRHQGFDLVLAPAELRWNRLYVDSAQLRRRDNEGAQPLVTVNRFEIPITWRLVRGLPARGVLGSSGGVHAFLPWARGGEATLDGTVDFTELPLPAVLNPLKIGGKVAFEGRFTMDAEAQVGTQLPDGTLQADATGLVVEGVVISGIRLPRTRLDSVSAEVETGRSVNVRRFDYRGDLQGTLSGTITPNLRDPRNSLLALRISTAFRDSWLAELGDLRPILEGFLDRGRAIVGLNGTVGRPLMRPARAGGG